MRMHADGPIVSEPQAICDYCGKKKPDSQMAGMCVKCGKYLCSECAKLKRNKVYCPDHAGCFIATAAYGTPMAEELDVLRKFRDEKMEPNILGKHFVTLYYNLSPPLARVIARNERMRAFVRLNLKPIIRYLNHRHKQDV